jgi:predicted DCC family thiol-disulfide oxidoreductase YuxK
VKLPGSLADLPQPLYFFDGYCVLCSGFVQFCFRHDGDGTLKFASAQSPLGVRLLKTLGLPTETLDRTILLVEGDEVFSQSTAVLRSLRHLSGWPRIKAFETGAGGKFRFDVEIGLPGIGRLVRYRGWLTDR